MTKTELKWRLGKLPTPEEVTKLLEKELITKEEARDILFKEEIDEERDVTSYKEEIRFLRELVDKLSNDRGKITEVIKYIQPHYSGSWTTPYVGWTAVSTTGTCESSCSVAGSLVGDTTGIYYTSGTGDCGYTGFKDIETF